MCRALGQASVSRGLECGGSGLKQLCTRQVPGEVREGFLEEGGWGRALFLPRTASPAAQAVYS